MGGRIDQRLDVNELERPVADVEARVVGIGRVVGHDDLLPCGLVLAWTQPLRLAVLDQESLRKVDPLFQLAHPLFQLIEFAKAGLNIVQRLALLGRVHYTGRQFRPLTRTQALRPKSKENSEQSVSGDVPGLTFTRGEPNAPRSEERRVGKEGRPRATRDERQREEK